MQSFDTETDHTPTADSGVRTGSFVAISEIPKGTNARIELPDGDELAVFNINGEYYAIENRCPHKGAPFKGVR